MGAKRDINATQLIAEEYAAAVNANNTQRMLIAGEMRSGCQTRYKRNGSLLLGKYAVAV